jgi:chromosome segregation ATPase
LKADEFEKFLAAPDSDSRFWSQPHIQRLLAPAALPGGGGAIPSPQTPQGYVKAIEKAVNVLDGVERELVEEVRSAGQEVATALDALDGRIAALARDADPAERARLEERLAELNARDSTEGDGHQRMRQLIDEQLGLARSLADQLDVAKERRARLWDLLKTLWLQVANLKARAAEDAFHSGEISAKIRAISDDIQRYVEASDETVRLLSE